MNEEWKEIEGWTKYKVSNLGRVWNTLTDVEVSQVLTGIPQYKYVNLHLKGRKSELVRVHRLVAKAFVEGWSEEFNIADHIDRDKMNNRVDNLRWTSHSGNQRNTDNSIWIGDVFLKNFVNRYDNPDAAYSHIFASYNKGIVIEEAVLKYEDFLEYGSKRKTVEWHGNIVNLNRLCEELGKDYESVYRRLSLDWPVWNALYDVPINHHCSIEIPSSKVTGYWYSAPKYLADEMSYGQKVIMDLFSEGKTYEELLTYDSLDYLRQTVCGVTGTIVELCKHYGKTTSSVQTRMSKGMSLEEALTSPPERVKKVTIDGVSGSPKYWYESFGLGYKTVKKKKDSLKCSFEDILKYFGVDLSDKTITYTD